VEVPFSFHLVNHTRLRYTQRKKRKKKKKKKKKDQKFVQYSGPMDMTPTFSKRSGQLRESGKRIVQKIAEFEIREHRERKKKTDSL